MAKRNGWGLIGTGRIARPLAATGVRVDGIDISQALVDVLRTQPGGAGIAVTIGNYADVRAWGFRPPFVPA